MKQPVLFIHGGGAGAYDADEKLAASLQSALGTQYQVRYPQMPNEDAPEVEAWKAQITQELSAFSGGVILAGHSLGASMLLKYLSEVPVEQPIAGIFLVAAPYWGRKTGRLTSMRCPTTSPHASPTQFPFSFTTVAAMKSCRSNIWQCMPQNFPRRRSVSSTDVDTSSTTTCRT
jgi:uncharacterized protein